jgi:hypothetical protein
MCDLYLQVLTEICWHISQISAPLLSLFSIVPAKVITHFFHLAMLVSFFVLFFFDDFSIALVFDYPLLTFCLPYSYPNYTLPLPCAYPLFTREVAWGAA